MPFEFRTAERRRAKLRLGLSAPAGAGKTLGALMLAYGITGDWAKIALIDTERGSGELYAGHYIRELNLTIGEYAYGSIEEPYEVRKYQEAHGAAVRAGFEVIILDSISHAWAGAGGLLDKKDNISGAGGSEKSSYYAWRRVTPEHNAFVDMMLASPAHIIATMRSKTEYVVEKNSRGETEIRKVGLAPIQRDGMDYEFTAVLDIDQASHMAHASKDRTSIFDGSFVKITPDVGRKLREWLESGAEPLPPPAPPEDKAAMGTDQLIFRTLSTTTLAELETMLGDTKTQRDWLAKHRPELDEKVRQALGVMKAKFATPVENAPDLPPVETAETRPGVPPAKLTEPQPAPTLFAR